MHAIAKTLCVLALISAAGCAGQTQWQQPGSDDTRLQSDLTQCRREAARKVDEDLDRRFDAHGDPTMGRTSSFGSRMAAYDARKSERALVDRCMRARGYAPADKEKPKQ